MFLIQDFNLKLDSQKGKFVARCRLGLAKLWQERNVFGKNRGANPSNLKIIHSLWKEHDLGVFFFFFRNSIKAFGKNLI